MSHRPISRPLAISVAALGLTAATPSLADAASAAPGCHAPAGGHVVAASRASHSQIYRKHITVNGISTLRYWGCNQASGKLVRLLDTKDFGSNGSSSFTRLTFAGHYLAGLITKSSPVGEELDVGFYDLSGTLAPIVSLLGTSTAASKPQLLKLQLSSTGRFAWLQETPGINAPSEGVRALEYKRGNPTTHHLDDADQGTITDLKLNGTRLSWRHGGCVRRATLPIASKRP